MTMVVRQEKDLMKELKGVFKQTKGGTKISLREGVKYLKESMKEKE